MAAGSLAPSTALPSDGTIAGGVLTIDLDAIVQNYAFLQRTVGSASCAAVVKADGYGLGATRIVPRLLQAGCREFFVATVSEALSLRPFVDAPARLYVLCSPVAAALSTIVPLGIVPVLNSIEDVEAVRCFARSARQQLFVAIHLDTGLSRLGLSAADVPSLRRMPLPSNVSVELVLSHLANAGDQNDPFNADQLKAFERAAEAFPGIRRSLSASSGIFLGPAYRFEQARPGAALYGINPVPSLPNPMLPVVRLRARILQIRTVPAGTGVGYGPLFTTRRQSQIATVALGYADGLLRSGSCKAAMWSGAHRLPVAGAVSMDCITLDVTDVPDGRLRPGSFVDVLGPRQSVDDLAATLGTIGYEVLTSLGHRYHREYVTGSEPDRPTP